MRPLSRVLALAASVVAVACFELSGPPGGVVSISSLIAVSPSVAVGDAMRDQFAQPAPLQLFAFDVNGDTIETVEKRFLALDSAVRIDADGLVVGAVVNREAQIVGQVVDEDGDVLQTPILRIRVVPRPTAVDTAGTPPDTLRYRGEQFDTLSAPFGLRVTRESAPVAFWLVRFRIDSSSVKSNGSAIAPVQLINAQSNVATDTASTNGEGLGLIRLRLVVAAMDSANRANRKVDTVIVRATTVWYPGDSVRLVEPRTARFRFIIRPQ